MREMVRGGQDEGRLIDETTNRIFHRAIAIAPTLARKYSREPPT